MFASAWIKVLDTLHKSLMSIFSALGKGTNGKLILKARFELLAALFMADEFQTLNKLSTKHDGVACCEIENVFVSNPLTP